MCRDTSVKFGWIHWIIRLQRTNIFSQCVRYIWCKDQDVIRKGNTSKAPPVRFRWPHMKETMSHETGGLLKPRRPVCWCHTQMHARTQEQNSLCFMPASHQMGHLLPSSAQHDARLVVPTDRKPSSPHTSWQAGNVTAPLVEDQMLIAARSCCSAATCLTRGDCQVCALDGLWGKACIEPANAPEVSETLWRTPPSRYGGKSQQSGRLMFHC